MSLEVYYRKRTTSMESIQHIFESIISEGKHLLEDAERKDPENASSTNESVSDFLKKATLISLLAIPRILDADQLKSLPSLSQDAIAQVAKETSETLLNGYTKAQVANIVARTLFAEAANQSEEAKQAVASVIWNRANHDPKNLVEVCFRRKQFSCWNDEHPATNSNYTPKNYQIKIPKKVTKNSIDEQAWTDCKELASGLVNGSFESTIGNLNAYYNPSKASPNWASSMSNVKKIGDHKFGYLSEQDPTRKSSKKSSIYVVKAGDTLGKIAKKLNTTEDALAKKNRIKDKNKISVGQKLRYS